MREAMDILCRRRIMASIAFAGSSVLMPRTAWCHAGNTLRDAAASAYIYGVPLIEMARARAMHFDKGNRPNRLGHDRTLNTPATQDVTTPNNDTLYSTAWCDTASGPIRIILPPTGKRYMSVAFLDMFTNNVAVVGTRSTGGDARTFTLIGPDMAANDSTTIRCPTRWALILVRTLVDGPDDLAAALAIQDAIRLEAAQAQVPPPYATRDAGWTEFLRSLQALIVENGLPDTDGAPLQQLARLGIRPTGGFDPARVSHAAADIASGLEEGKMAIATAAHRGAVVDGWGYPKANLGIFGQDHAYRAKIAMGGLGALPCAEAMYMRALGVDNRPFFPAGRDALLRFPPGRLPPVDGFWSATMYEVTAAGQYFLFDNAIDRYAIGDRTPGLRFNEDGSLDIWMTGAAPRFGRSNWLPLPAGRPWGVVLRAYVPRPALLDGSYTLPAVTML